MIQKDMGEKAKPRLGKSGAATEVWSGRATMEVRSGRGAGAEPGGWGRCRERARATRSGG